MFFARTNTSWTRQLKADILFLLSCLPLVIGAAFLLNSLRTNHLPLIREEEDLRLARSAGQPIYQTEPIAVEILEWEAALSAHSNDQEVWLDARDDAFYAIAHIAGARNLSKRKFADHFSVFTRETPKSASLVVYCSGIDCDDAIIVARALKRLGYERVRVFAEGWEAWEKAGLPRGP